MNYLIWEDLTWDTYRNSLKQVPELNMEDREIWKKLRILSVTDFIGNIWKKRNWVCLPIPYPTGQI